MSNVDFKVSLLGKTFVMEALKDALDMDTPLAIELVSTLKKKMDSLTPSSTQTSKMEGHASTERVVQLTKDLDECSSAAKNDFFTTLTDLGLASEGCVEDEVDRVVDDRLSDYCDKGEVVKMINGAWNGA